MPPPDPSTREGASLFAADEDDTELLLGEETSEGITEPCQAECQVVAVGFTDQPGAKDLFGGARKQYVNLTFKRVRQGDAELDSDNQIGHTPPFMVRISPPCARTVRVKLERTLNRGGFPAGSSTLSARERGLTHLQYARTERSYTTDGNGELLVEEGLPISALGGGQFRVKAALDGQGWVEGSNSVNVMRRVYLRPVRSFAAGKDTAYGAMSAIRGQLDSLGIEVKRLTSTNAGHLGVVEQASLATPLQTLGSRALNSTTEHIRDLKPYSVAVIIGEFISRSIVMRSFQVDVPRGGDGQFPATVDVLLQLSASGVTRQHIHVPLDDGSSFGVDSHVRGGGHTEPLVAAQVTGLGSFSRQLTVNLAAVAARFPTAAALRVTLRVKTIDGWAVGWAYTDFPVIYMNMRDPNTDTVLSANLAEALMVHELGHKLHLAASGEAGQPDLQPHHYPTGHDGTTHVGPHCSHGVPAGTNLNTDAAVAAADCTMWGSLEGVTAFCDECKTSLRKVDLAGGF
jgi:hypothetical protein